MSEKWRTIPWAEDYAVSDAGRLRRLRGKGPNKPGIIAGFIGSGGYRRSYLPDGKGGSRQFRTHRVVCEVFHGPAPSCRPFVRHLDGDITNNRAENLAWGSAQENAEDRDRHGTTARGEAQGPSKLTEDAVRQIRRSFTGQRGELTHLAAEHGVSRQAVSYAVRGETWSHVAIEERPL